MIFAQDHHLASRWQRLGSDTNLLNLKLLFFHQHHGNLRLVEYKNSHDNVFSFFLFIFMDKMQHTYYTLQWNLWDERTLTFEMGDNIKNWQPSDSMIFQSKHIVLEKLENAWKKRCYF